MKFTLVVMTSILLAVSTQATPFSISLNDQDQFQLTKAMSNIDYRNKTEEVVNADRPGWYVLKNYFLLDSSSAVSVRCSERFQEGSAVGIKQGCQITFNYENNTDLVSAKDGFVSELAVATITDVNTVSALSSALSGGTGSRSFFSKEQVQLANPSTGQKFAAFRLRMECTKVSCTVSAVK